MNSNGNLYLYLIYIVFQSVQTPISPSAPHIDIEIPCALKLKLEDDCYFIKRKKKVNIIIVQVIKLDVKFCQADTFFLKQKNVCYTSCV